MLNQGEASYMLEEEVQLWVAAGVHCDLEQRHEDVLQHFLEVTQLLVCVIDVARREKEKRVASQLQASFCSLNSDGTFASVQDCKYY